jgi:alpha-L-fucosidase 2
MLTTTTSDASATHAPCGALWFPQAAQRWFEALPIGNGRLGGMVYGGGDVERIRLSEATAWSGAPATTDVSPTALEQLPRIRELFFAGHYAHAQQLAGEHLLGNPVSFGTNLPLPEVRLDHGSNLGSRPGDIHTHDPQGYRRSLSLDDGLVSVRYEVDGVVFSREVFASHPHGVIVLRESADRPGAVGFRLSFATAGMPGCVDGPIESQLTNTTATLTLRGRAVEELHSDGTQGVDVEIQAVLIADTGTIKASDDALIVSGADSVTLVIAVGTSWDGADAHARASELATAASAADYADLLAAHVADHRRLMGRVSLDLGTTSVDQRDLPTDVRRARYAAGAEDPELEALYFSYGRYLTMAGSREDSPLPLALQGVWNDGLASSAPWTNDFHLDINTQQNYWAAEPTNLAECQQPLIRFVEQLSRSGQTTAAAMYGAPGWVAHTVTNAWGYTAPGSGLGWGIHVTGGAWIALQLWEHYEYGLDERFLRERAYPVFRGAAEFFLDYLVAEPENGWLVAGPADSPENWYLSPDGDKCSVAMGNTCDRVFIDAILRICAEAAETLDVDDELRKRIIQARAALPPLRVGRWGQLQEWLHDFAEAEPNHRHTSHLGALYPERQIGPRSTPDLARAAEVTIERRSSAEGWEQVEWVEANFTAYYARLLKGDLALRHFRRLIGDTSEANLMSYSAAGVAGAEANIYSFDGNSAGSAGVAEMLLQSDSNSDGGSQLELLPALPPQWQDGSVRGLRARGGFTVDLTWHAGRLTWARVRASTPAATTRIRYGDDVIAVSLTANESITISAS